MVTPELARRAQFGRQALVRCGLALISVVGQAADVDAATTPLIDYAGLHSYAAAGLGAMASTYLASGSVDVPLRRSVSFGVAGGGVYSYEYLVAQGYGRMTSFAAARATIRVWQRDGWAFGGALSALRAADLALEATDDKPPADPGWAPQPIPWSTWRLIPQIGAAGKVAEIDGMTVRIRALVGLPFSLDGGAIPPSDSLTLNGELSVEARPGLEVVLGGGDLLGVRAIW